MITYNAIIKYFDAICDQHSQINSFSYGEISLMDEDKFTEYPAVHLTPTSTTIDDQIVTYGFEVVVFDRYDGENNKMENEAVCLSDSLLLLQDFCKELTKGKYFINEDTLINLQVPISANPFIDTKPDICSGWSTQFSIETPNEVTQCNIPYYLAEQQNALDFTLPVDIDLSWWSRESIHSSIILSSNEITAYLPIYSKPKVPLYQLSKMTTGPSWDAVKNAIHFSYGNAIGLDMTLSGETHSIIMRIKDFGASYISGGGDNRLLSVGGTTHLYLNIDNVKSTLKLTNQNASPAISKNSNFPVCPNNSELKRKEPLTIGLIFNNSLCTMYYGLDANSLNYVAYTFTLDGKDLQIGGEIGGAFSNFYMQEFIYSPTDFGTNIFPLMEWINYR
tara:strand:+ start:2963 stop:4135 length:1173 start_codon:yes stop_codon:yes gene_type:complete